MDGYLQEIAEAKRKADERRAELAEAAEMLRGAMTEGFAALQQLASRDIALSFSNERHEVCYSL